MALNDNDILFDSFEAFLTHYVAKYFIMIVQILSLIQKMQNNNLENPQLLDVVCLTIKCFKPVLSGYYW